MLLHHLQRISASLYLFRLRSSEAQTSYYPAMASTGLEHQGTGSIRSYRGEKYPYDGTPMARGVDDEASPYSPDGDDSLKPRIDSTHRKLKPRHIQLIGIGG